MFCVFFVILRRKLFILSSIKEVPTAYDNVRNMLNLTLKQYEIFTFYFRTFDNKLFFVSCKKDGGS
jgi:hypothetical protein